MQYNISLDLASIHEWGLNVQQGVVFAYVTTAAGWATRDRSDPEFFNLSNGKIASELGMVSSKRDTMLRHVLALVELGLINRKSVKKHQYLSLTEKGKTWHRRRDVSPVPDEHREKRPPAPGETSRKEREILPSNQYTNTSVNQISEQIRTVAPQKRPPSLPDCIPDAQWNAYLKSRKEKRHPMNDAALALAADCIRDRIAEGYDPTVVMKLFVGGGWRHAKAAWIDKAMADEQPAGRQAGESPDQYAKRAAARYQADIESGADISVDDMKAAQDADPFYYADEHEGIQL